MDGKREGNGNGRNVQESSCMDGMAAWWVGVGEGVDASGLSQSRQGVCVRPKSERTARPGAAARADSTE
jgi:hypothetical protein